jgi:acetyl-CoA acetyltransferase
MSSEEMMQAVCDTIAVNDKRDAYIRLVVSRGPGDLGIDPARVNVNGGACALGHPIGATGARLITTLLHALRRRGLRRGVASQCIGGGEATAIAIEIAD